MTDIDKNLQTIETEKDIQSVKTTAQNNAEVVTTAQNDVQSVEVVDNQSVEASVEDKDERVKTQNNKCIEDAENRHSNAPKKCGKVDKVFAKDILKCTLVLLAIALVSGILLGVLNWATYVDPNATIVGKVSAFYGVDSANVEKSDALSNYDNINACFIASNESGERVGYCYYSVGTGAKDGTMELLVYIDVEGVIKDIQVYEQGETAGYFNRVEKANKPKYVGIDVDEIEALTLVKGKDDDELAKGEVNAVSQSTYTSTGYHNGIASAVNAYKQAKNGGVL